MEAPPPLLVRVLGGNVVTSTMVLGCLNTTDATVLRRLHPVFPAAVAAVPWADTTPAVRDVVQWRAVLPAATALKVAAKAPIGRDEALVTLGGVTVLDLSACDSVTDDVIARLPPTLRALNVSACKRITQHVSFTHLVALETLDCSRTDVVAAGLARLPPSLRKLRIYRCRLPDTADFSHLHNLRVVDCTSFDELSSATAASLPLSLEVLDVGIDGGVAFVYPHYLLPRGWSLAHLARLRVLKASHAYIDDAAIATLPPSLHLLDLEDCNMLSSAVSFAHLTYLHTLNLRHTTIDAAALVTLPPLLVSLDLFGTRMLTPGAVFPRLPALRVLNVSHSGLGKAAIGSMPVGLEELHLVDCSNVTQHASLDHLSALQVLQSVGTDLSPVAIAASRARGCFAPADGSMALKDGGLVTSLVVLPDSRLVGGTLDGRLTLWEVAERDAVAELKLRGSYANALVVLLDGHRVAVGTTLGIVVWDTREAPPDSGATIAFASSVQALAVARDGHLVAGCECGTLSMIDVDACTVVKMLAAHDKAVRAVAALLDGRVASVPSECRSVSLWDVCAGTCVSTLAGHTDDVTSLAVLPDGRLASGGSDTTVQLWDIGSGACIRVLTDHTGSVYALAVLSSNRLASVSADSTIRVWDTRDDARGTGGALTQRPHVLVIEADIALYGLVALPNNRLGAGGGSGVYLWQLPPYDVDI